MNLTGEYHADVGALMAENEELKKAEKKAFWWSAEFTKTMHDNKIQFAWTDYKSKDKT